jgi:hypothetical protein
MKTTSSIVLLVFLTGCASAPPARNERPPRPLPPASNLVPQCEVTVRFNEDERSVKESEYLDSMFCLGVMEGILGLNYYLDFAAFCLPPEGIKTWHAAKAVVEYARKYPEKLSMVETEFAVEALRSAYPCSQ